MSRQPVKPANGEFPYRVARSVLWGDCDPAGVIYTPRVFDYAEEAVEGWFRNIVGIAWLDLYRKMGMGSPTVHIGCDYLRKLEPGQDIEVHVRVEKIGRSSLNFLIDGIDGAGEHYFRIDQVTCFVKSPEFDPIPIPEEFRQRIAAYQKSCGDD